MSIDTSFLADGIIRVDGAGAPLQGFLTEIQTAKFN
jgi:hypothetical protein